MSVNFQCISALQLTLEIEKDAFGQIYPENMLGFRKESNIGQLFKMYHVKPGITRDFLCDNFGPKLLYRIQTQMSRYQPPHIDPSRTFAINYYLDLCGTNSITHFYRNCDDVTPIESHHIQLGRWCKLDVTTPHNVVGITGLRIAITVCDG